MKQSTTSLTVHGWDNNKLASQSDLSSPLWHDKNARINQCLFHSTALVFQTIVSPYCMRLMIFHKIFRPLLLLCTGASRNPIPNNWTKLLKFCTLIRLGHEIWNYIFCFTVLNLNLPSWTMSLITIWLQLDWLFVILQQDIVVDQHFLVL